MDFQQTFLFLTASMRQENVFLILQGAPGGEFNGLSYLKSSRYRAMSAASEGVTPISGIAVPR